MLLYAADFAGKVVAITDGDTICPDSIITTIVWARMHFEVVTAFHLL
jgi:hypothetical protein